MSTVISIDRISKKFSNTQALSAVSFEVDYGGLFGLIGPDGAGKTTLFRILSTLLVPDSGKAEVAGFDVVKDYRRIRRIIGYVPGRFSLYHDLTVMENLNFFSRVYGTNPDENYGLIKDVFIHLEPFKNRLAGKLSGGMKQKLALSCALVHRPEILILDEPTTGVDAVSRKEFWELLKRICTEGITVIVSTPYMDEAALCTKIGLIMEGKVLQVNTPFNIVQQYDKNLISVRTNKNSILSETLKNFEAGGETYFFGQYVHFSSKEKVDYGKLADFLSTNGHGDIEIRDCPPGIEDCFLSLMKK